MIGGGSWNNNASNLRSANRNRNTPDKRNNNLGFRLFAEYINDMVGECRSRIALAYQGYVQIAILR